DITPAVGPVPARLWRLSHTGRQAGREGVLATISALSAALARSGHACDIAEATGAVARTYG
ncbi:MAG: alanine--glyoxylate aminotransferase family protein, partial [Rhizobiaceae bacterium]